MIRLSKFKHEVRLSKEVLALGSSFGASLAFHLLKYSKVNKMIGLSIPTNFMFHNIRGDEENLEELFLKIKYKYFSCEEHYNYKEFKEELDSISPILIANKIKNKKLLLFVGKEDRVVRPYQSYALCGKLRYKNMCKIVEVKGGHLLLADILKHHRVLHEIMDFLTL